MASGGQPALSRSNDPAQPDEQDLSEKRDGLYDLEDQGVAALPPLSDSLEEFYTTIPVADGWESKCLVIKPKANSGDKHPLIVFFHGGGFSFGTPKQVTRPGREWAEIHNATIVCPSYRQTPAYPWPQPLKDGWDVVSFLSKHAETDTRFGDVNLSHGFVVGGFSAGGSQGAVIGGIATLVASDPEYAANTLHPPAEELTRPITGLFVAIPVLLAEEMVPVAYKSQFTAMEDNRDDPNVNAAGVMSLLKNLQCTDYRSPWFSPVNILERALAGEVKFANHPRTYVQACEKDPLRDDPVIYEKMLARMPGMQVKTKIDIFPDDGHAAWTALPFESNSKNPTIKEATLGGMVWLLEGN